VCADSVVNSASEAAAEATVWLALSKILQFVKRLSDRAAERFKTPIETGRLLPTISLALAGIAPAPDDIRRNIPSN
jgi:hypothetical protein